MLYYQMAARHKYPDFGEYSVIKHFQYNQDTDSVRHCSVAVPKNN